MKAVVLELSFLITKEAAAMSQSNLCDGRNCKFNFKEYFFFNLLAYTDLKLNLLEKVLVSFEELRK